MGVLYVFNGIGRECTRYEYNGRLDVFLKDKNIDNSLCLVSGRKVDSDYQVKNGDIVFIRTVPGALTTGLLITSIVLSVVALGVGIGFGVSSYLKNKNLQEKMERAQQAQKKLKEKTEVLPFLRGASNRPATGQTMPFIMGEHFFTPYRLCPAHFTFSGENGQDEFYNVVLECGFNPLVLRSVSLGKTVIKKFDTDTPQDGVYRFDRGTYYDERNIIEIRQTGDFTTDIFNKKIVPDFVNEKLEHDHGKDAKPIIRQAAENVLAIEAVILFDGLRWFNDENWSEQSATVIPYWTNNPDDDNPVWHPFTFEQNGVQSNTFRYNTKKQMRFSARKTFSAAESFGKKISVKIERTTQKAEKNSQEECFFYMLQTTCYDAQKSSDAELVPCKVLEDRERDMCTRLALRIAANENTKDMLEEINVIAAACARTWNGIEWSADKKPTRNSAAWVLEVLTNKHHNASRYEDTELDLESFGALYEHCEAEKLYTDGVITKSEPKKKTIETILGNVHSALVLNPDGLIEVITDKKENNVIALLNSDNIISISTTKDFKRKSDGKKCTFVNRNADYQIDNVVIMRPGTERTVQSVLTETALEYITEHEHAFKYVRRQLAQEILQPKTVTVKVGKEGAYYPLFSCVLLQHRSLKIGLSFGTIESLEVVNDKLTALYSDSYFDFAEGHRYGIVINCITENTRGVLPVKVIGTGRTNVLYLPDPLPTNSPVIPEAGNSFSFGLLSEEGDFSRITSKMKIIDIAPEKEGYSLTLVDYNEALYEYGDIPAYRSNLTTPPAHGPAIKNDTVTHAEMIEKLAEVRMPPSPTAYYDAAHTRVEETVIYELPAPIETGNAYNIVSSFSLAPCRGKMIKIEAAGYIKRGNRRLNVHLFNNNWSFLENCTTVIELAASYDVKKTITRYIPHDYHDWLIGAWYPGSDDFSLCKAVLTELRITVIGSAQAVDTTGNANLMTGQNITIEHETKLGKVYNFYGPNCALQGALTQARGEQWSHSRWIYIPDIEQKFYGKEIWHQKKTAYHHTITTAYNQTVDLSAHKGQMILVNAIAYRTGSGGYLKLTVCEKNAAGATIKTIYDSGSTFDTSSAGGVPKFINLPASLTPGSTGIFFSATFTPANGNNQLKIRELSLYQYTKNHIRLFSNGMTDYAFLNFGRTIIDFYTHLNEWNNLHIGIPREKLIGGWHHLVVNNALTDTQARKEIWIDGKLVSRKNQNGNFADLNKNRGIKNINMANDKDGFYWTQGKLAHLLHFDRMLTEQEIRWLYLNPQYPIKNYSLADWQLDGNNADNALVRNTPKYLGVTQTVPEDRAVLIVKGEKLGNVVANTGDWVLMGAAAGGWEQGVCYRWTGEAWLSLAPAQNYEAQYQACLAHICEIPELTQNTGHYGALFAKMLATQKALIDSLIVKKLQVDSDTANPNNFELVINEKEGILAKKNGKAILQVSPHGESVFTGKVNVGAVQLLDSGVFIKDGEISIENKGWKGSLRPCDNGVEFAIMSEGEGGAMTKQQMRTVIRNGVLSLFVLGSISCENIYKNNSAGQEWVGPVVEFILNSIAYGDNKWVATGYSFNNDGGAFTYGVYTSPNGKTWTKKILSQDHRRFYYYVAYGNNMWIIGGMGCVYTSPDGVTWTKRSIPDDRFVQKIAYGNNMWAALAVGHIYTSPDGVTWTKRHSQSNYEYGGGSIAYGNNMWIASIGVHTGFGAPSAILHSTDQTVTWVSQ